jgi:hypothetical protein
VPADSKVKEAQVRTSQFTYSGLVVVVALGLVGTSPSGGAPLGSVLSPGLGPLPSSDPACYESSTVFCEDFSEGNFEHFDNYDHSPPVSHQIVHMPGPFDKSPTNKVAKIINRVNTAATSGDMVKLLPAPADHMYVRYYMMWDPAFPLSTTKGHVGGGFFAGNRAMLGVSGNRPVPPYVPHPFAQTWLELQPSTTNHPPGWMSLYSYYEDMYQDCANPSGACWGDHFPCWMDQGQSYCTKAAHRPKVQQQVIHNGMWYCFEVYVNLGTAANYFSDGVMDFWINGAEQGPFTHLTQRSSSSLKLTLAYWAFYFHQVNTRVNRIVYYDNLIISHKRIGCG